MGMVKQLAWPLTTTLRTPALKPTAPRPALDSLLEMVKQLAWPLTTTLRTPALKPTAPRPALDSLLAQTIMQTALPLRTPPPRTVSLLPPPTVTWNSVLRARKHALLAMISATTRQALPLVTWAAVELTERPVHLPAAARSRCAPQIFATTTLAR